MKNYFKRIYHVFMAHKNVYVGYRRDERIRRFVFDMKLAILNKKYE